MSLSPKTVRAQLALLKPLLGSCSLETIRKGQEKIGELTGVKCRRQVSVKIHSFPQFEAAWCIPKDQRRQGVILYLHGGGYCCGGLDYAQGYGCMISTWLGARVFAPAYRLAPEHPYPAAAEDALKAYRYLLDKGYRKITLCGESAGGGLCYGLCMRLRELGLPMPCGIVALSPWTDLTGSGASYESNREKDPSIEKKVLEFYARCYTDAPADPMVSPLFGALRGMPPSLIFAGGDEIMLDDAVQLHEKLLAAGCKSQLQIAPERWHAYLFYNLHEDQKDLILMNRFLNQVMGRESKLRWLRLDNAAKIYPAAQRQNWSNVFRISATLREQVDRQVLSQALDVTVRRFPSIAARLRKGVFWYYLQQLEHAPAIREESCCPLVPMSRKEIRQCALRVIVYQGRIAVEFFHSLTDGNGALVFLKTLVAEYILQKYGVHVPAQQGVLGRLEEPSNEEMEDSFLKYAGPVNASRAQNTAWRLGGTPNPDDFKTLTCFTLPVEQVLKKAKEQGVTLTVYLCSVMMMALQNMQAEAVPVRMFRKYIRVLIPVNLRKLFPSKTLRNFALYTTPEIDPRLGDYSFSDICKAVTHRMGLEITPQYMSTMIAVNVSSEKLMAVRVIPLFLKNLIMKAIFNAVGERKSCLSMSNLGAVQVPEEMRHYVERFDFILGVQAAAPYNCGVLSYGDTLYINFIRDVQEPTLEANFCKVLQDLGLTPQVQSNL